MMEYLFCLVGWCTATLFIGVCFGYSVAKNELR